MQQDSIHSSVAGSRQRSHSPAKANIEPSASVMHYRGRRLNGTGAIER
jgi:hypothetical protein